MYVCRTVYILILNIYSEKIAHVVLQTDVVLAVERTRTTTNATENSIAKKKLKYFFSFLNIGLFLCWVLLVS